MIPICIVAFLLVSISVGEDGKLVIENDIPESISQNKQAIKVLENKKDFDNFVTNDIVRIGQG